MALKNTLVESKQSQPRSQGPNPISYFPCYCSKFHGRLPLISQPRTARTLYNFSFVYQHLLKRQEQYPPSSNLFSTCPTRKDINNNLTILKNNAFLSFYSSNHRCAPNNNKKKIRVIITEIQMSILDGKYLIKILSN